MKKSIFAAAIALFLAVGAYAQAQNTQTPKERPTPEQMAQRATERMTERFKLTDAQAKQVYEVNLEQIKQSQEQRKEAAAERKDAAVKMKQILTAEQYAQWEQARQARMQRQGQHGKPCAKAAGCGKSCAKAQSGSCAKAAAKSCDKPADKSCAKTANKSCDKSTKSCDKAAGKSCAKSGSCASAKK